MSFGLKFNWNSVLNIITAQHERVVSTNHRKEFNIF